MTAPVLTKNERYGILRLAKRARGLYTAEKQALVFIADAQTMQEGVCRKALIRARDFGYCGRQIQRGIHGNRRKGKLEFPGLITRGIVSVTGYIKGGRAPGGEGLTPTYVINRDVLLKFIPEIDDGPMGDTKGDTLGDTSPKKGDTLDDLIPTSSSSSSLGGSSNTTALSVVARRAQTESEGHVVVDSSLPKNQKRGQEQLTVLSLEDRDDAFHDARRARQMERKTPDAEIFREYKKVFDRLEREYQTRESFERKCFDEKTDYRTNPDYAAMPQGAHFEKGLGHTAKHRHDAAELYRNLGRDIALAKWEDFLVNENHATTTGVPLFDEDGYTPTGKFVSDTVERTWLLHDFVVYCDE
jgi:hypothetical protein